MQEALKEARQAMREEEVPVGAVVVFENRIIGRGHNQVENPQRNDRDGEHAQNVTEKSIHKLRLELISHAPDGR